MHQGGQCSRNPLGVAVWYIGGQPWVCQPSSTSEERQQGSQTIKVWQINFSVAIRTDLGPSSSPTYLLYSPANGHATSPPCSCTLPTLSAPAQTTLTLIKAMVSAKQPVLGFSSHLASDTEAKKWGSKGSSPLCVYFYPLLMCHLQATQTKLGTNSVCCFSGTESHIRPTSPLLYAAQGKSDFIAS